MMKQAGRKIMVLFLAVLLALPGFCLASHAAPAEQPEISCPYVICYNMEFDRILLEKGADTTIYPASFTKLMTALLAYEFRREAGNITVTVTEEMLSGAGGTSMGLKVGEVLDLDSLLTGLVINSANDAALVLASTVGGNVSAFVEMMNRRAEELGMTGTYYGNPTGVDSALMHTTLRDTLTLCRTLYRVNDFMVLSSEERATIPATNLTAQREYTNKNALIPFSYVSDYMVRGARGFIAGYTAMAGYCCVSCREADGATTLVLLSGGQDQSENADGSQISSYRDAAKLLNWARDAFAVQEVLQKETVLTEEKVRLAGSVDHTILVAGDTLKSLLPKDTDMKTEIRRELRTDGDVLEAPILKGNKYGEVDLYYGEELLGTVDLVAQANVNLSRYLMVWDGIVRFFSTGPAKIFLIIVITAAVLYVVILIATVYVQYLRNTRERRRVIREMEERENRRLKEVRRIERQQAQKDRLRARNAMREGFRIFSGESEVLGSGRAVARVPEKYRHNPSAPPRHPQVNTRVSRPAPARRPVQRPAAQRPTAQRRPAQRPTAQRPTAQRPTAQRTAAQRPVQARPAPKRPTAQRPAARPAQGRTKPQTQKRTNIKKWPE